MLKELDLGEPQTRRTVLDVSLAAYSVEAALLGVQDFPPLRETLDDLAANPNVFFGCHLAGILSGVMELEHGDQFTEICRLVVAPTAFRRGLASQLLRAAVALGQPLRVMTAQANEPAVKLYEKHGFRIVRVDDTRVPGMPLVYLESRPRRA